MEDANCALLRFASGVLGIAELNWILPRGFPAAGDHRLDVVGSAGSLSIATLETGLRRADGQRAVQVDTASAPSVQGHPGGMFYSSSATSSTVCAGGHARRHAGRRRAGPPDRARRRASGRRRDAVDSLTEAPGRPVSGASARRSLARQHGQELGAAEQGDDAAGRLVA